MPSLNPELDLWLGLSVRHRFRRAFGSLETGAPSAGQFSTRPTGTESEGDADLELERASRACRARKTAVERGYETSSRGSPLPIRSTKFSA